MQAQKSIEERSNINQNQNQNQTNPNQITPILDRQIDEIIADLPKSYGKNLRILPLENLKTVVSYIMVLKTEINPSRHYKKDIIEALTKFGLWFRYNNNFKDVTRDDVISFLDSLRKSEAVDPLHKWIGTYNTYRIHLIRSFKWYYGDVRIHRHFVCHSR